MVPVPYPGAAARIAGLSTVVAVSSSQLNSYSGLNNSSYSQFSSSGNSLLTSTSNYQQQGHATGNGKELVRESSNGRLPALPTKTVKVKFCLKYEVQYGQLIRIVGSHPNIGNWQLQSAPVMQWAPGHRWECVVEFPAGTVIEYKYVVTHYNAEDNQSWQNGSNAVLALSAEDDNVEVRDNWSNGPGSKVVVDGSQEHTRETKLAVWAREMLQYQKEAKEAKLELYRATDENQALRNEVARLKMESSLVKAEAEKRVMELEEENFLLRAQLTQAQIAMKSTLEEAISLLTAELAEEETDGGLEESTYHFGTEEAPYETYASNYDEPVERERAVFTASEEANNYETSKGGGFFDRWRNIL